MHTHTQRERERGLSANIENCRKGSNRRKVSELVIN